MIFFLKAIFAFIAVSAQNECSDTVYKVLGNLAKRSPTYFQDSVPLCDRYLVKSWYVAIHYKMPTTAPWLGSCGTTYPYWLDGSILKLFVNKNTSYFALSIFRSCFEDITFILMFKLF